MTEPSEVFDDIVTNDAIVKRASDITKHYDALIDGINYYNMLGEGNSSGEWSGRYRFSQ